MLALPWGMRVEPGSGWTTLIHRRWKGSDTRDVPVHRAKAVKLLPSRGRHPEGFVRGQSNKWNV